MINRSRNCSRIFTVLVVLFQSMVFSREVITLQPMGKVEPDILKTASEGMTGLYNISVFISPALEMPKEAYYQPRQRYRAEKLLDYLALIPGEQQKRIVGITGADISTSKGQYTDWGIFGLARLSGETAVISYFRLGRKKVSSFLFTSRLAKVVNHEVGHLLGLEHCLSTGCLMQDCKGRISVVDDEKNALCSVCRRKVKEFLK